MDECRPRRLEPADRPPRGTWALLSDRVFGAYFAGSLISNTGTYLQNVTAVLVVFDLTRSALAVGLVTTAQFATQLVVAPWAGVLADKLDRRRLMLLGLALGLSGALVLAAGALFWTVTAWLVIAMIGVAGFGQALTGPSAQSVLPELVAPGELAQAAALHSVSFNLARAIGPAAGAALYLVAGAGPTFLVNALTYGVFIAVVLRLPIRQVTRAARGRGALRAGLAHVRGRPELTLFLTATAVIAVAMEPVNTLSASFVAMFGGSESLVGILVSAFGVGSVLVVALIGPLRKAVGAERAGAAGMAVLVVGMLGLAVSPNPAVAVVALLVAGAGYLIGVSDFNAALLAGLSPEYRGRVMALYAVALLGTRPLAALLHGAVADLWSARVATALGVLPVVLVAVLVLRRTRTRTASVRTNGEADEREGR